MTDSNPPTRLTSRLLGLHSGRLSTLLHPVLKRLLAQLPLFALAVAFCGCTTSPPLSVDVPYVEQSPFECGVATMQMAFEQQGIDYELERLRKRVFIPALNGTTIGVMAKAAREFGATATIDKGNNHLLAFWLNQGYSPIILWGPKEGEEIGHFLIVNAVTISHDKFRVHSGRNSDKWIPFTEFMDRWEEGGFRVLVVDGPQLENVAAKKSGSKPVSRF